MYFKSFQNLIEQDTHYQRIFNLKGSSSALLLALCRKPFLYIETTEENAQKLWRDINFYRDALKKESVFFLPDPDGPSLSGERASVIYSLREHDSLVTSFKNLSSPFLSREELRRSVFLLQKGMTLGRTEIEKKLHSLGYKSVPIVTEKGEYRRNGWIMDIFPSTSEKPLRLEFFGDEIETIKLFDVDSQISGDEISDFLIFPSEEQPCGEPLIELMEDRKIFISDSIQEKERISVDAVYLSHYPFDGSGYDAGVFSIQGIGILSKERKNLEDLVKKIRLLQIENKIVLVVSSNTQAERIKNILRNGDVIAPLIYKNEIFEYKGNVAITIGELSSYLFIPNFLILTEKEIFGDRLGYRPIKKSKVTRLLTSLEDLRVGDYVVHEDHGIGEFCGLVRQSTEGLNEDLILINYENGRLYLPIQRITSIHKYHSEEGIVPKIDKLGGKNWQRTKERVKKKVQKMAEKLLSLYAERKVKKGFSFSPDTELHSEFDSFFSYDETTDQIQAIEDIKRDMESEKPMDRLICGDVGYGKTEVAMRAAFKAVYDGMQVAVLVPTTILCEQHYRTFKSRFSAFPVNIDYLSRFKIKREQKDTIKALAKGEIDIIIGTHSLLSREVHFQNLGLLIIDEEHRFGVSQKEKIKELKKGIDVITLTATPIPRTLSMALSDIRDMSLIETPPEERLAVKSFVSVFDDSLIKDAVKRELERDGQVFFVHNRIKDIHKIVNYLTNLIPEAKISVAHGQMAERELENVMRKFYNGEINMLVSTAIIGSGLDIPTANTIIINRADMMGLADLYQLRGRVGRGKVRAYAYFLIPREDIITEEAKKRLQAVQEMSYLGAGFRLALKDLEIRGAGNLLGPEQSGHIQAVGFDLYMEMLEKAIADIKGIKIEEEFDPIIKLHVQAFIPEDYIEDVTLRLSLYRRVASSKTHESLKALKSEIEDRFGIMPDEVKHLFDIMRLKIIARDLRIIKLHDMPGRVVVNFSPETKVEPNYIFALAKSENLRIRFLQDGFEFFLKGKNWHEIYQEISGILEELNRMTPLLV